jgi:glycosyltransferase involved in cell wall biosynthesis
MSLKPDLQHLGFVSNSLFVIQRGDDFFAPPWYLRLHEGFLRMFPKVTLYCSLTVPDDPFWGRECTQKIDLPNLTVCLVPLKMGRPLLGGFAQMAVYWNTINQADVICIDLPGELGFFAALVCRLRSKKYFARVFGDWGKAIYLDHQGNFSGRVKAFIGDWMARTVLRRAAFALFQGRELSGTYAPETKGIATREVIHSTLSSEMFYERGNRAFHSPLRLITVSRLVPLKGLDILLKAMQLLTEQGLEVEWWCVGEGPARQAIERTAAELGQTQRVKFLGNIPNGPELYRLYQAADIFVLPSLTEGISQSLLEALAHSLPAVASEVGGIPGVLTNNVHGLLVPPGDPVALAAAIHKLAEQPTLAAQLQQAGFARVQNFRADILRQSFREMIETTFGRIGVTAN